MAWKLSDAQLKKRPASREAEGSSNKRGMTFVKAGEKADEAMSMRSFNSDLGTFAQGSPEKTASAQRNSEANDEDMDLLAIMATLLLSCSDRLRGLESTSFYLLISPKNNPMVEAGQNAYQAYLAHMESLGPQEKANHEHGPPHIHIFQAIMQVLTGETIEFKPQSAPLVKALKDYVAEMKEADLQHVCDDLRYFRFQKAHESSQIKLQFAAPVLVQVEFENGKKVSTSLASLISRLLVSQGMTRKMGKAPAGWMERQISKAIEKRT